MNGDPYKGVVVDLVDPYFTLEVKNIGGFKASSPGGNYAIWWMRRHPGRWALVGEGTTGLTRQLLKVCPDIRVYERKRQVYACYPHPAGEDLRSALERRPITMGIHLPEITRDEFNWSTAELAEACQIARDNLFPVSS